MTQLPLQIEYGGIAPDNIMGYISVNSQGDKSVLDLDTVPKKCEPFHATKRDMNRATKVLESNGFQVIAHSKLGIGICGPKDAYESLTGGKIKSVKRLMSVGGGRESYVTHFDIVGDEQPECLGVGVADTATAKIEGVFIETPRTFFNTFPAEMPPQVSKFHLLVPDGVATGLNTGAAHQSGYTGQGVNVAMVDSGQYPHPYFIARSYDIQQTITTVPGTSPTQDPVGHGTGESANIFAVAPGATLHPFRTTDDSGNLVAGIQGFMLAKSLGPDILTNSWGTEYGGGNTLNPHQSSWALEILDAIEQGIFVVFAAGNGGVPIEPQVAFSAGGVYRSPLGTLEASDYSSAFNSPLFPSVTVPDVCGLVGQKPRAQYIMLPVPPGSLLDSLMSSPSNNDPGDGTGSSDGWALFSGTSAAAPQIAGVVALMLEAKPGLVYEQIYEALTETAIDVTSGTSALGFTAQTGPDVATGAGLVNASAAVQYAIDNF